MPRQRFGNYDVLARLASGGAGSVFLALDDRSAPPKLVCIKTLLPNRANNPDYVAMFFDEGRLAARLDHPNCIRIFDLGETDGIYHISMEFIFGETLRKLANTIKHARRALPINSVASIVASVCDGLQHAHAMTDEQGRSYQLVHRDICPSNIMIDFTGQTKILDLGMAKAQTGRAPTVAGIVKGKFSYMSPEQISGSRVDKRSDIYSLGIVFFECLSSRRLYAGDTPEAVARLILERGAPRLKEVVPHIPEALDHVCAKALAPAPQDRFQTAEEMGDAIRAYLADHPHGSTSTAIARLLFERFGDMIPRRQQVLEEVRSGQFNESELLEALDAAAVWSTDFGGKPEPLQAQQNLPEEAQGTIPDYSLPSNVPQLIEHISSEGNGTMPFSPQVLGHSKAPSYEGPLGRMQLAPDDSAVALDRRLAKLDGEGKYDLGENETINEFDEAANTQLVADPAISGFVDTRAPRNTNPTEAPPDMPIDTGRTPLTDPSMLQSENTEDLDDVATAIAPPAEPSLQVQNGRGAPRPSTMIPAPTNRVVIAAAMGFGVAIGIVIGMILSRLLFGSSSAPPSF